MTDFKTEQEAFWAGEFGNAYMLRNEGQKLLSSNTAFFAKALSRAIGISSVIEFGANIGMNIMAMKRIFPEAKFSAVEINKNACEKLSEIGFVDVNCCSIMDYSTNYKFDISIIKGVLIHINPVVLSEVYDVLYKSTSRYILIAEYYNSTPVEVLYRGNAGKLFKRDFAGEMLDRYTNLKLVDYGFVYKRDCLFPQDDITWFLLEKV